MSIQDFINHARKIPQDQRTLKINALIDIIDSYEIAKKDVSDMKRSIYEFYSLTYLAELVSLMPGHFKSMNKKAISIDNVFYIKPQIAQLLRLVS